MQSRNIHYLRSRLFLPTQSRFEKENTKDLNYKKPVSSLILENNGFISGSGNGLTTLLPLGKRVLNKIKEIIREEMNKIGGQEISMPSLSELSLWKKTNRDEIIGAEMFQLKDRKDRQLCLSPTHEEAVTSLVSKYYKCLSNKCLGENQSLILYQITPKFRDEQQSKHGLLRGREFLMKDMYSFHLSERCAIDTYEHVCRGYSSVLNRLDLQYIKVEASVGNMGGLKSHEYQIESPIGEDVVYQCMECGKAISSDLVENKAINNICSIVKCGNSKENTIKKK